MKFKCTITVNYPDTEKPVEAALTDGPMNVREIGMVLANLAKQEPEMTSFTLIAVPVKE